MDQEDGLIWVYGLGDDSVIAFTDFGIETLIGLIEIYKADPDPPQTLKVTTLRPTPHAYSDRCRPPFFHFSLSCACKQSFTVLAPAPRCSMASLFFTGDSQDQSVGEATRSIARCQGSDVLLLALPSKYVRSVQRIASHFISFCLRRG
jgi:hypothetical protein